MKLDSRIYEGKKPLTSLDDEEAKQFIGEEGYFANALLPFTDLVYATKGTLDEVTWDVAEEGTFKISGCNLKYKYFLPDDWVQSTEEEYQFASDSLKLAGELHSFLYGHCYVLPNDIDRKTIDEIMTRHSHEEKKFLKDVLARVLTYGEGRW